jgi:hypothetical protein
MDKMLGRGARLALLDPSGEGTYAETVRYVIHGPDRVAAPICAGFDADDTGRLRRELAEVRASHVWLHVPTPAIEQALGVSLPDTASSLLVRSGDGWRQVKSWPCPGYRRPWEIPE